MRLVSSLLLLALTAPVLASDLIKKPSAHDVATTIDRLSNAVEAKGMTIFARIDHSAGARAIGMSLPASQVLIFGTPKAGTPLMQKDPRIGLDLPLRVLAYQDSEGKTWVSYHDPRDLRADYPLGELPIPDGMAKAVGALTDQATAP